MNFNRRRLLTGAGQWGALSALQAHGLSWAQNASKAPSNLSDRVLVLIELKGGNDSMNAVIPYTDPLYAQYRGSIAIPSQEVLRIDTKHGLHPALQPLVPIWEKNELAIVQGLGYPDPNLSHFRSIDIWNSASKSNEYLDQGWVSRAMQAGLNTRAKFTSEGVLVAINEQGPLAGAQAVSLRSPDTFLSQSRLANANVSTGNAALQHILRVENNILDAASGLKGDKFTFKTAFPNGEFGSAVHTAAQVIAMQRGQAGIPVIVLSLGSFDTHVNQLARQAVLLKQLAEGCAALKSALMELGAWDRTMVMTYSEFGRRARQNQSNGTDHGTVASHFVMGGAVKGGLIGKAPDLSRLDSTQNLLYTTDFRQLFSTVAKDWWGLNPDAVVRGKFDTLPLLRA